MDERYLHTEIYLNGEESEVLERLGLESSSDEPGVPAPCIIDLWGVVFFYEAIAGGGTVVQCSGGEPMHITTGFRDFAFAFGAAANRRKYVMTVDHA